MSQSEPVRPTKKIKTVFLLIKDKNGDYICTECSKPVKKIDRLPNRGWICEDCHYGTCPKGGGCDA